jgi:hypothetical protein
MRRLIASLPLLLVPFLSALAYSQTEPKAPTLNETLTWLRGASEESESLGGTVHHTFESKGNSGCSVVITETRPEAGPDFWIKVSFSLSDIDPSDIIYVQDLPEIEGVNKGLSSVTFHTTNYSKKIFVTSNSHLRSEPVATYDYLYLTNTWFAPRFAKALKRAAELCGAKPSSF